ADAPTARVRLVLRGGRTLEETTTVVRGDALSPVPRDEITAKFVSLTAPILGESHARKVVDVVEDADTLEDVGALTAMVVAGRADRLEATWRALKREQVYALRTPVFFAGLLPGWLTLRALGGARSLLDPQPLRELITASVELERIRTSSISLLVTATD